MLQRILLMCLLLNATAIAQISHLVTNGDGSIAYFSSTLKLLGDRSEQNWPKIFRYRQDTGRIEFAYQITSYLYVGSSNVSSITTPYMLEYPDVSSDGNSLVYTAVASGVCVGGSSCLNYSGASPYLVDGDQSAPALLFPDAGSIRLSRNGRYLFEFPYSSVSIGAGVSIPALVDRQTNQRVNLGWQQGMPVGDAYQLISDSGIVLIGNTLFDLARYDPDQPVASAFTQLNMSQTPILQRLSADGRRIVYEAYDTDHPVLIQYNVDSGQETILAQGPASAAPAAQVSASFQPWLSDDGSLILYLDSPAPGSPHQVWLRQTNGASASTQLTSEPEGITNAVLSGFRNVVYAVTATNRILRIQIAPRTVQELSGAITTLTGSGVPGSAAHLAGLAVPLDSSLGSVKIGGLNAPVQNVTATSLDVQIPWELPLPDLNGSEIPVTFESESKSAFEPPEITIYYVKPVFLRQGPTAPSSETPPVIAHEDFHGLITPNDPARPGEILHFYMTGLGPVSAAIATGQVTPPGRLYTATGPPTCHFYSGQQPTMVPALPLFVGLAPGMLGIYQLDVQLPAQSFPDPIFTCAGYLPKITQYDFVPVAAAP